MAMSDREPGLLRPEWEEHRRIWLAWPRQDRWPARKTARLRAEMSAFVQAVAEFEEVALLHEPGDPPAPELKRSGIGWVPADYGDIWLRDSGPVFYGDTALVGHFDGWGKRDPAWMRDENLAYQIAHLAGWPTCELSDMHLEGGALESNGNVVLTTRGCLLDRRRNPGMREAAMVQILEAHFRCPVLVLPGIIEAGDITRGHIDGFCQFLAPDTVLMYESHDGTNRYATQKVDLERLLPGIRVMTYPATPAKADVQCHLNFVWANGGTMVPRCGDADADDTFAQLLREFCPERRIVYVSVPTIAGDGGWIHCSSLHEPARNVPSGIAVE